MSTPVVPILHHYRASPFSEKVRLALGFKKIAWRGVTVPNMAPKPDVTTLTGGYRKTPFLQIGADIYCDSALVFDVLEHLAPAPTFYPAHLKGVARIVAQWADERLFWAAMAHNFHRDGIAQVFAAAPQAAVEAFMNDRRAMTAGGARRTPQPDATAAYRSYLRRLSHMAEEHEFLFGDQPCVADFAAYHPLWFTRTITPAVAHVLAPTPAVLEWMDRMAAIGHGAHDAMTAADAIEVAARAEPMPAGANRLVDSAFQDEHGIALGERVAITAESFGTEETDGVLLAATRTHYSLRRDDPRAGAVHVHFPRIGYILKKAEKP